ncbi:carbohydrate ABC transporter permease [Auraticoccus cholistanensis]|nr:carbohydrate ABC transporter permease [Auraticoccus cholistanensis]
MTEQISRNKVDSRDMPLASAANAPSSPPVTGPGTPARTRRRSYSRHRNGPLFWVAIIALSAVFVVPLLWMGLTSVRSQPDSVTTPITLIPREFTLRAYQLIFNETQNPVLLWALNSLVAAVLHSLLVLVVASMAAYALARMEFRGRGLIFGVLIATLFIPGFIFMMPNYLMMDRLGWLDTLTALVVPGAAGAFGVFFLRQFFLSIPRELEETALIDGANTWTILTRIIIPLSKPALVTLGILSFLANWNDFIWPIFVLFSPERMTLPAGLATLQGAYVTDYPVIMAGATIASVPVLVLYVFLQRYVIEGVATSGIKG